MMLARGPRALVVASAFCAVVAAPARASAQSPAECAQSYERAQRQRLHQKLRASRADLEVCASVECSVNLREDCATWLSEVKVALPSVKLSQNPPPGLGDVRVAAGPVTATIDGEPLPNPFSGLALDIDPGPHVLRFEWPGKDAVTVNVTVREGEKGREVVVDRPPYATGAPETPAAPPTPSAAGARSRSTLPFVIAGAGVALAAAGSGFEIWGLSKRADVNACQPPGCSLATYGSDKASAQQTFLAGDILIGAGIAAAATGAVLYWLERPRVGRPTIGAAPTAGGFLASFVASF